MDIVQIFLYMSVIARQRNISNEIPKCKKEYHKSQWRKISRFLCVDSFPAFRPKLRAALDFAKHVYTPRPVRSRSNGTHDYCEVETKMCQKKEVSASDNDGL